MTYTISEENNGRTVKELLFSVLGLSYAHIKHLKFIDNGIMLNGEKVTVRRVVSTGDTLTLALEDRENGSRLTPSSIPLDIVYEDDCIIVPNKPPYMPTHPSHLHHGDTVADALAYIFAKRALPFVFRPINRLDKNTSGLTLIAKDRVSAGRLSLAMRESRIEKQYLAVLAGEMPEHIGYCATIVTHMKRTQQSIIVRQVCSADEGGDLAITQYKILAVANGYTLVLASPKTGRTHQLRVHFAHLGYPIAGDDMYGCEDGNIARHALHAWRLSFVHPQTACRLTLHAPLPADMLSLISKAFSCLWQSDAEGYLAGFSGDFADSL